MQFRVNMPAQTQENAKETQKIGDAIRKIALRLFFICKFPCKTRKELI